MEQLVAECAYYVELYAPCCNKTATRLYFRIDNIEEA